MDNSLLQAGMWIAAGGLMMVFLKRRRSRKNTR
jgi:hypothetical protein